MSAKPQQPRKNQAPRGDDYIVAPNRDAFQKEVSALKSQIAAKIETVKATRKRTDELVKSRGSEEEQKLRAELNRILEERRKLFNIDDKLKAEAAGYETSVKRKLSEIASLRPTKGPRTVKELDQHVQQLEDEVSSGQLSIVQEKANLKQVTQLKKLRAQYGQVDKLQKEIDDLRAQAAAVRGQFDRKAVAALNEERSKIQVQLDKFNESRDKRRAEFSKSRDERTKLQTEIDELRALLDKKHEDFNNSFTEFRAKLDEARRSRKIQQRIDTAVAEDEKRVEAAKAKVAAANEPAFTQNLVVARQLSNYFNTTRTNKKLQLDISAIEGLVFLNLPIPTSTEELKDIQQKIDEKAEFYKENSERVTSEKIDRAEKDLEAVIASVKSKEDYAAEFAKDQDALDLKEKENQKANGKERTNNNNRDRKDRTNNRNNNRNNNRKGKESSDKKEKTDSPETIVTGSEAAAPTPADAAVVDDVVAAETADKKTESEPSAAAPAAVPAAVPAADAETKEDKVE